MNLHGMLAQKEPFSDVAIPISLLDVAQNVKFKSREPFIAEMLGEPSSDLGQTRFFPAWTCRVVSRLSEVVCKNVSGLLVERTPGHDEDSRAPFLIKGSVTLEPFFVTGLGRAVRLFRHLVSWCLADRGRFFCATIEHVWCVPGCNLHSPKRLARQGRVKLAFLPFALIAEHLLSGGTFLSSVRWRSGPGHASAWRRARKLCPKPAEFWFAAIWPASAVGKTH